MESFGGENRLLTVLKDQLLTEDRITKYTDNRLRDVICRLQHVRLSYLKQKALLQLLQDLSKQNSLLQQRLSLSDECIRHKDLLGLEERHLKAQRSSGKEWAGMKRELLEGIGRQASKECEKSIQWIHNNNNVSRGIRESQLTKFPDVLQERLSMMKIKEDEMRKLKEELVRQREEKHKLICDNCQELLHILSEHQLKYIAQESQTKLNYLSTKTKALVLKLIVIKLQLMVVTYKPDKNAALKEIRSHLDACHQQLELQLLETKRTLEHYNTLGPDFISLAEDYHHIKGEIENKQWALQELGKTNQYF